MLISVWPSFDRRMSPSSIPRNSDPLSPPISSRAVRYWLACLTISPRIWFLAQPVSSAAIATPRRTRRKMMTACRPRARNRTIEPRRGRCTRSSVSTRVPTGDCGRSAVILDDLQQPLEVERFLHEFVGGGLGGPHLIKSGEDHDGDIGQIG